MAKASGFMKHFFGVSGAIFLSRILGLARVRLEAEILGGGAVASAWQLVSSYANILRRLLGEGALGTALTPIVAELEHEEGKAAVKGALAVVFPCLGIVLGAIVIFAALAALIVGRFFTAESNLRVYLVCTLLPIVMPYAIFICMTGVVTAVLNYGKRFVLPAFCSLLMNIALVGGLALGWYWRESEGTLDIIKFLHILSYLFLLSGVIQMVLMFIQLKLLGFFPDFFSWRKHLGVLKKLWDLALPGFIGGAALQISFLIDRNLALMINEQGVASLGYVDRLVDLPIGIFGVAMGQVLMARMSRSAANGDIGELAGEMNFALRQLLFLCIPMAVGIFLFHELMLKVICLGGAYTMENLNAARRVCMFYGSGIPFFCALKIIIPAFHARQDMETPLRCSLIAIAVNLCLSVALLKPLEQGGIALATTLSAALHIVLLLYFLCRSGVNVEFRKVSGTLLRSILVSVGSGAAAAFGLQRFYCGSGRLADFTALCIAGSVFGVLYLIGSWMTGSAEIKELLKRFSGKKSA